MLILHADAKLMHRELGCRGSRSLPVQSICSLRKTESAALREMILAADTVEEREAALEKISSISSRADFDGLLCEALEGNACYNLVSLDPPLHEFVTN